MFDTPRWQRLNEKITSIIGAEAVQALVCSLILSVILTVVGLILYAIFGGSGGSIFTLLGIGFWVFLALSILLFVEQMVFT